MDRHDPPTIAVVGAGPVGLAFAARLLSGPCARSFRLRVLDAAPPRAWTADELDARVYALSRASQHILERAGAWDRILARRASPYRRMRVWEGPRPDGASSIDFDSADAGEPDLGTIVEDRLIRDTLLHEIGRSEAADFKADAALEGVRVTPERVVLELAGGETIHASLLVAADGGESRVRALLDIPVVAHAYGQHALVTHVATQHPHRKTAYQRFLPGGPLAFLPLSDGRSSVVWSLPEARAEGLFRDGDEAFLEALQEASGGVLGRLGPATPRARFPLQMLHALRYCQPRVALLGDAAHGVHPLAGQGMNLGLLDAACLAEEIERAHRRGQHVGDLGALRRYERRRKASNLRMMLALDALHRLFGMPRWAAPLRALGLHAVDCAPPAKRALMRHAMWPDGIPSSEPLARDARAEPGWGR